jgi:hypothetical protein
VVVPRHSSVFGNSAGEAVALPACSAAGLACLKLFSNHSISNYISHFLFAK